MNRKFRIFYFSGTGNTLLCAKTVDDELKKAGMRTELLNIETIRDDNIDINASNPILMFPVYAYGPPKIISRFIDKLPDGNGENWALVLNYGLLASNAYKITAKMLKSKGYNVSYCAGVRMPANYINLYNPPKMDTCEKRIDRGIKKLEMISRDLITAKKNRIKKGMFFLGLPLRGLYKAFVSPSILGRESIWPI